MSLSPGTRLGPYEITATLGAGGMGEVYRATDTRLKRAVAVKVLPEIFAGDAERLARFQREAELLASLNHPNIAAVYGLEPAGDATALVMELVDGPTLAEVISRGPMSLADARAVGRQIALALEAAHAQGIIHRDLKPANVKVRPDGTVKVLDFGLAKALDPPVSTGVSQDSPTITSPAMTMRGVILGTAAYMSPEQARGRAVDRRADIWAFGCVLYEMLSGRRPFAGDDVSEILERVIDREPDWGTLPDSVPPVLERFIRRCLEKKPEERLHDAADVRLALDGAFDVPAPAAAPAGVVPVSRWHRVWPAGVAAAATALLAWGLRPAPPPPQPVTQFEDVLAPGEDFRNGARAVAALAPDGRSYVLNLNQGLFLRRLEDRVARLIPGTEGPLAGPAFAPDGQWLVFWDQASAQLVKIPVTGGTPVPLVAATNPLGLSWDRAETILYAQEDGIWRIPATGGQAEKVIEAVDGERLYHPQWLPGADAVLFTSRGRNDRWEDARLIVQSRDGTRTVVLEHAHAGRVVASGHLIFSRVEEGSPTGIVSAVPFDLSTRMVRGDAVPLVAGIRATGNFFVGLANMAVADNGTFLYVPALPPLRRTLVWVDRHGGEEPVDDLPASLYAYARISPDGTHLALDDRDGNDIWIWNLQSRNRAKLTVGEAGGTYPIWLDNDRIAYSKADAVWQQSVSAPGPPSILVDRPTDALGPLSPYFRSPDGTGITFRASGGFTLVTEGQATPDWRVDGTNPMISPDGRWMAYESDESGTYEIYVRPYPLVQTLRVPVSAGGGTQPAWSPDGREIFYLQGGGRIQPERLMVATVDGSGATFAVTGQRQLLDFRPYRNVVVIRGYDVAADGRFLFIKEVPDTGGRPRAPRIVIMQHWLDEVKRVAPVR